MQHFAAFAVVFAVFASVALANVNGPIDPKRPTINDLINGNRPKLAFIPPPPMKSEKSQVYIPSEPEQVQSVPLPPVIFNQVPQNLQVADGVNPHQQQQQKPVPNLPSPQVARPGGRFA